jgi:hypothetical protein
MSPRLTKTKTPGLTSTKRSKFGNKRVVMDGVTHPSKKQGMRWILLRQMERDGQIRDLKREVKYELVVNGMKVCTYIADHVYEVPAVDCCPRIVWEPVVEDVKGFKTATYNLKKKLMKAVHNIDIREV